MSNTTSNAVTEARAADPITKTIFAQGIHLLAARWNREIPPELSVIYANAIRRAGLSGAEYIAGVTRAIETREFFPAPEHIIQLARPEAPADIRAGEVFEAVLALRVYDPRYGMRLSLDAVEAAHGMAARKAVLATGAQRLVTLTDDSFPFVFRDFCRAYGETEAAERATDAVQLMLPGTQRKDVVITGRRERQLTAPVPVVDVVTRVGESMAGGAS